MSKLMIHGKLNSLTTSVIICTRNRVKEVAKLCTSLAQQTIGPNQLIVVDSSDTPLNIHAAFEQVFNNELFPQTDLIYKHTKPGLTYQRNQGITVATGELIYFLDDDLLLPPDYIEQMNGTFLEHPEYAGGMATIAGTKPQAVSYNRIFRTLFLMQRDYASGNFTYSGMPTHPYGSMEFKKVELLNGCGVYRSSVFKKYRFDENLHGYAYMEDCDFSRRVSYEFPLFFNPLVALYHLNSPSGRDHVIDNRAMFIRNYSYLFFKNFYPRNRVTIFAYCWTIIGLFLEAIIWRKNGFIKGYCKGLKQFYWDDFTKPSQRDIPVQGN